ncbi:Probable ribonuclease P/MRP protein subunit POP5 [Linum grandiflorum]
MVSFKNRYMVMEVFLDPKNRDLKSNDPIIITPFNLLKAIKDSILLNFGECGLASSLCSLQVKYVNHITKICVIRVSRNIRACKVAALKCDENKFEHYKLMPGELLSADASQPMQNCLEKLKLLDY